MGSLIDGIVSKFSKKRPPIKAGPINGNDPNDAFSPAGRAKIKAGMKAKAANAPVQVKAKSASDMVMKGKTRDPIKRRLDMSGNKDQSLRDAL